MADDIVKKIATQIREVAEESARIDLTVADFIAEDIDDIKRYAKERGLSAAQTIALVLKGLEIGLLDYGKIKFETVVTLLEKAKEQLRRLL